MPRIGLVIDIAPAPDGEGFVASCKTFPGVSFRGETHDEALLAAGEGFRQLMERIGGGEVTTAAIINPPRPTN